MQYFQELTQKILKYTNKSCPIYIACSGGVDSTFLVYFYKKIFPKSDIFAIIVNHNLQNDSVIVANETARIVNSWGCNAVILQWNHEEILQSIEEMARIARYQLMIDFCKKQNAQNLVVAHHIDDKIETFFMNAMRGTGIRGLTSMREISQINGFEIFRPMVNCVFKKDIIDFMKIHNISWFEDKTNHDCNFTRNNIRHNFPLSLKQKYGILKTISNLEMEYMKKLNIFDSFWNENLLNILQNSDDIQIIFSKNIINIDDFCARMLLEKSFNIIYKKHREIRQNTIKNFILWLNSNVLRANFCLMNFIKKDNKIICEKNN